MEELDDAEAFGGRDIIGTVVNQIGVVDVAGDDPRGTIESCAAGNLVKVRTGMSHDAEEVVDAQQAENDRECLDAEHFDVVIG